jgi:hypothetical protein
MIFAATTRTARSIARALALLRERQAVIAVLDRDAIREVARGSDRAVRQTLLASALRREIAAEVTR